MASSEGFQQHFSIISKFVCCGFYMKKNVAFTVISFAVLKWDDCLSVQLPFELPVQIPVQLLLELYTSKLTRWKCEWTRIWTTLYNVILRIARNLLETRENIKIESHPFYHIICDWFSWGSSKKQQQHFFEKKIPKRPFFKIAIFQNRQFSKCFCENFMDWSLV